MAGDNNYSPGQDYVKQAQNWQSVPTKDAMKQSLIDRGRNHSAADVKNARMGYTYSCADDYKMGTIKDNQIYVATTNDQHNQLTKGEPITAQGGVSGYFSDQATVDACKNADGSLNNTKYNDMCQIAPYREGGMAGAGDASYKPHVECFDIDRDALKKNYQTDDFNAAIAKCEANNQFGSGGGNQGFNPHLNEMIENGTLKHNPSMSYSDASLNKDGVNNANHLTDSKVPEVDYNDMMADAKDRTKDCVKNNTKHPSEEACQNGFPKNKDGIKSDTGNAEQWDKGKYSDQSKGAEQPKQAEPTKGVERPKRTEASKSGEQDRNANVKGSEQGKTGSQKGTEHTKKDGQDSGNQAKGTDQAKRTDQTKGNDQSKGTNQAKGTDQSKNAQQSKGQGQKQDNSLGTGPKDNSAKRGSGQGQRQKQDTTLGAGPSNDRVKQKNAERHSSSGPSGGGTASKDSGMSSGGSSGGTSGGSSGGGSSKSSGMGM